MASTRPDRARARRRRPDSDRLLASSVAGLLLVSSAVLGYLAVRPPDLVRESAAVVTASPLPTAATGASPSGRLVAAARAVARPAGAVDRPAGEVVRPAPPEGPAEPVRLVAERLRVDALVAPIESADGVLVPPSDPQQVGWWRSGARPGDRSGRILLTGHTVHTGGGAFDDLELLRRGDRLRLRTTDGWLAYRVLRTEFLTVAELARRSSRLFRPGGPERLVLVTCEGWDGSGYDGNTVVVAAPEWSPVAPLD